MTFPIVAGTAASQTTVASTSHTVSQPASIVAGELLLAFFACNNHSANPSWGNSYTRVQMSTANNIQGDWAWKVAGASEPATFTITTSASREAAHRVYRIQGHDSSTNAPQSAGFWNSGTNASPSIAGVNPTGGAKDYLAIEAVAADSGFVVTAASTSFTNLETSDSGSTANTSAAMSTARREWNTASIAPGLTTLEGAEGWLGIVVAIHPGNEGTGGAPVVVRRSLLGVGT